MRQTCRAVPTLPIASLSMLLAACAQAAEPAAPTAPPPVGVERSLIVKGQGYFPVALRLLDGRIAVVLRGGAGHLGIQGRLDIVFSSDEGKTWTQPAVVADAPDDDRNPAVGQGADGAIVVAFWRTATYDGQGKYDPKSSKPTGTWVTRSTDAGRHWITPTAIDVADIGFGSPYGRIVTLPDNSMLLAIFGGTIGAGPLPANNRYHSYVYRSTSHGRTWHRYSEIGDAAEQFNETSLLLLPSGRIMAAMRSRAGAVWIADSVSHGQTWTKPRQVTPTSVHPADLCLLDPSQVLMTVGDRSQDFGVRGMVGNVEKGFDWQRRFILANDAVSGDCGYPSSVLLGDGRVLTAYYATGVKQQPTWGVHCGALIYRP